MKVTEIQIDLTNKVKIINNKQESIWTPLLKMTEVARLQHIRVVETETFWDCEISGLSRPRLFETMKCQGCRDWDSLRLRNLKVVETETGRDRSKVVETETFPRVSLISALHLYAQPVCAATTPQTSRACQLCSPATPTSAFCCPGRHHTRQTHLSLGKKTRHIWIGFTVLTPVTKLLI